MSPKPATGRAGLIAFFVIAIALGALLYTKAIQLGRFEHTVIDPGPPMPSIITNKIRPANHATNVLPNTFIAADLFLPNDGAGIKPETMNDQTIHLYKLANGQKTAVPGMVNSTTAGESIIFQPAGMLEPNTQYEFDVDGITDTTGASFKPFTSTFTTAGGQTLTSFPVAFEKVALPASDMHIPFNFPTCLCFGPGDDHHLYEATLFGTIYRFDVNPDGTLANPYMYDTVAKATGGHRIVIGFCFDPHSTPDNPMVWITSNDFTLEGAADWSSRVALLTGKNLEHYQDVIVGLPRAWKDHMALSLMFGPGGFLYLSQGSNTTVGEKDKIWKLREEHVLNASLLQIDTAAVLANLNATGKPLNVKTEDGGTYDPWAHNAPVKIYATGMRCGYSMIWHRNGSIYMPVNGGAAGGTTPATPDDFKDVPRRTDQEANGSYTGPDIPSIEDMTEVLDDLFIRIEKGGYYGHPNPKRGEYVLNAGNMTGGKKLVEVLEYPQGTAPDRNYRGILWDLGKNFSVDGIIEYKGDAFGGALDGKILCTRYSGGKDVIVMVPDAKGNITECLTGIDGCTQFIDPLPLVEDERTGFIYVGETGGRRIITLLRPRISNPESNSVLCEIGPQDPNHIKTGAAVGR